METVKTCTCCGVTKSITEFSGNGNGGIKSRCKPCCSAQTREWQLQNPEKAREHVSTWRERNREKDRENAREWRAKNPDKHREAAKAWAQKNKDKIAQAKLRKELSLTPEEKLYKLYHAARRSHPRRNKEFDLTLEHLLDLWRDQCGLCAYTKLPLVAQGNQINSISIDRVDNSKGYIVGNVQLVCAAINRMKSVYSENEFIGLCNLVSQNNPVGDNSVDLAVNR